MFYEQVHTEAPIVPQMEISTPDGRMAVRAIAAMSSAEIARLVPDEALRRAVIDAGRRGLVSWPGAERWQMVAAAGDPVPVIDHNSYIVSRVHALDVLARPNDSQRHTQIDDAIGEVSVIGVVAMDFEKGAVGLASGSVGTPHVNVPESARRLAWSQVMADVMELSLDADMAAESAFEWPHGRPPVASICVYGDIARDHTAIGSVSEVFGVDVFHPSAAMVASNPCSRWAYELARCIEVRTANIFGEIVSLNPPAPPEGVPTPKQLQSELSRIKMKTIAKMAVGASVVLAGAWFGRGYKLLDVSETGA